MSTDTLHDEAVEALLKIRHAVQTSDMAEAIAKFAKQNAIAVSRAQTRDLPLFDGLDGIAGEPTEAASPEPGGTDAPLPREQVPVTDLALADETLAAMEAFGFKTMGTVLRFHKAGCDWTTIPGIDEDSAHRLEGAISRFLVGAEGVADE